MTMRRHLLPGLLATVGMTVTLSACWFPGGGGPDCDPENQSDTTSITLDAQNTATVQDCIGGTGDEDVYTFVSDEIGTLTVTCVADPAVVWSVDSQSIGGSLGACETGAGDVETLVPKQGELVTFWLFGADDAATNLPYTLTFAFTSRVDGV